jgi:AAA family ATP:ADP antiporter
MMIGLLFWQFANQITKTEEAKRFYSMFGLLGNLGLVMTSLALYLFLDRQIIDLELKFLPVLTLVILSSVLVMIIYRWINANVLTDPKLYSPEEKKVKKSKVKLSVGESFKLIFSSKYLGLIAILVLAYGISMVLVESVWKDRVGQLYPSAQDYTVYMGKFQLYQGVGAILGMILGNNILRLTSWKFAASLTPLMILLTGIGFFGFIVFDDIIINYLDVLAFTTPLAIAVTIGMLQNVLSKSAKYSLFDSTKEMSYIPLDNELKTKGKAAVDVVGGRLGKSGGGIIVSTLFIIFPNLSFAEATPYLAAIFFGIVLLWLYSVRALSKEYTKALTDAKEDVKAS